MAKVLVSLVGHQPLPLLMAIRHIMPNYVIFLYSNIQSLKDRKDNLIRLLPAGVTPIDPITTVDPWHIRSVPERLQLVLEDHELGDAEIICDLTGGTKAMSIGLAEFAANGNHRVVYLESESGDPMLQEYEHRQGVLFRVAKPEEVRCNLSIEDFLRAFLGKVNMAPVLPKDPNAPGPRFEESVRAGFGVLQQTRELDEIKYAIKPIQSEEIDIILRKGNRIALVECKQGKESGSAYGILQLNNLASERYLGTYTKKILAVATNYPDNNAAMAAAHDVYVLELPSWQPGHSWTDEELQHFRDAVRKTVAR